MNTRVLVTGGAGFIGSHFVDRLIKEGCKTAVVDNLSAGKKENLNPKAVFYQADICDPLISKVFEKEKPDFVFHLAAHINLRESVENPVFDAKSNVLGTINILENCRNYNVKKIIFTSTGGAIYGEAKKIPTPEKCKENPLSPYGINKLIAEKYLNYYYSVFGLPFVSLRLANVYGPRQDFKGEAGVVAIFCNKMLSNNSLIINGDGKQTRDFVFVDDVIEAGILALKNNKVGVFNIGTGLETDINVIFKKLKEIINSKIEKEHGPSVLGEQKRSCLDSSLAQKELGWQAKYPLDNGLRKTVEYFKIKEYETNSSDSSL